MRAFLTFPRLAIAGAALFAAGFLAVASAHASCRPPQSWPDLLNRPQPRPDETLRYGSDPLQLVDVWRPAGRGLHPAVIMIHGGCWQTSVAERDIMNWIASDLRAHGIGVWNIEYRGVDRGGGWPGTYQDVGRAADLFAVEGARHGLSTRRHLVIGHSAGGHLAFWLAQRPALPKDSPVRGSNPIRIDAAISQGGLPDLAAAAALTDGACGQQAPRAMIGGHLAETSPVAMPLTHVPQYSFANGTDHVAPPAFARAYAAAQRQRGLKVSVTVTPGEGHVALIAPETRSWAKQRALIQRLLR